MTKPWDNELTPMVNKFCGLTKREQHNLERRLRHAEELLRNPPVSPPYVHPDITAHLKAAEAEDKS